MTPTTLTRRAALGCLAWLVLPTAARPTTSTFPTRPTRPVSGLMLAREAPATPDPQGFLVSEKFDGARALWDGRSLRFRSGLPVAAPAWFIAGLPDAPLDGELWLGRGRFEALAGAVRRARPRDEEWRAIRYQVFDQPGTSGPFAERASRLQALVRRHAWAPLVAVQQSTVQGAPALQQRLAAVVAAGGEGLMLHRADAQWRDGRSGALLKFKPRHDAEAQVIGHVAGQGRHQGRLGALRVRTPDGVVFLLGTGFSDAQREQPPALGSVVTFSHRGLTAAGVPRFASFLRLRSV